MSKKAKPNQCEVCGIHIKDRDYADLGEVRFRKRTCRQCFINLKREMGLTNREVPGRRRHGLPLGGTRNPVTKESATAKAAADLAAARERIAKTGEFFS